MTKDELIQSACQVIDKEIKGLEVLKESFSDAFVQAVEKMMNVKGRIIISGMGKSGHIGQKIAATLASTGTPAFFVHPGEASHGDLGMLTKDDLLLAISNSGESKEMADIISYSRRFGIPMIAITSVMDSTMSKAADLTLLIPNKKTAPEACPLGLAPTTSTTTTLALGDALAVALIEQKGFSAEEFRDRHPGGKLGNVLLRARDLMVKGDEMPLVPIEMRMSEALVIMTAKSWGCLGVTDDEGTLVGMITDGDLRRHMGHDLINKAAGDIMTKNPKTVIGDILCVEVLRLMNEKMITNLFVVDGQMKPLGLLTMHLLLQMGVA
ncbi:MAG: KpsF/GutQ family sugar-phosphate isomerase [Alphaproteobacteria bacterium]|nr:KpsF/GutQ family sugar-phosphate isomerase [Alphaproteobacteria bacterium]